MKHQSFRRFLAAALCALALLPQFAVAAQAADLIKTDELRVSIGDVRSIYFRDVPDGSHCGDGIRYAAYRRLFFGGGDDMFYPDALVTRGQTITVLHRLACGLDDSLDERDDALQWAIDNAILKGSGEDSYDENARVTRAQLATFLYRFVRYRGGDLGCSGDLSAYPDGASVPEYARVPLSWAMEHDIFTALVADSILPELSASRAQTAMVMTALLADMTGEPVAVQITKTAAQPLFTSASRANHDDIQSYVDSVAIKYGAIGLQVAVIEDGHVTDSYACGWATKNSDPMTADHKMRVASISKVVVGMDAMRLREDGSVDLETPIGTYWDASFRNPYYTDTPVNIRSILTHTSSIIIGEASSAYTAGGVRARQSGSAGYSHVVPGAISSWGYNNYAFGVLGLTLERAANKTMDTMLHQYFFDAMAIDGGFYAGDLADTSRLVTLYDHGGGVQRSTATQRNMHAGAAGSSGSYFAGGLTISANDLAKLVAVLASDGEYEGLRMLSDESVALMESRSARTVSDGFYQALPLRSRDNIYGRDTLYYHTGSAYGVYNCMSYDPETGDGVVVLTVGASASKDGNGIYAVCGDISNYIYEITK